MCVSCLKEKEKENKREKNYYFLFADCQKRSMSCDKASRRLKHLIGKAERLGLNSQDIIELPAAKKLIVKTRTSSTRNTILATIIFILIGGIVVASFCTPCI